MLRPLTFFAALGACAWLTGTAAGAAFTFTTGAPDGRAGLASRPATGGLMEIETADDFILGGTTLITGATFTGLIPVGVALSSINFAGVELYRVFPNDSVNPPSGMVPTRVNSPSDNAFASRDSTMGLTFTTTLLNSSFAVGNSIVNGINKSPNQLTGGEGPVNGQEVQINVTFTTPFVLIPTAADQGHYFFKPEAGLTSGTFLWLSTARTVPLFTGDLQAWIRNTNLDPDWLRAGTDIIGGTTFNEAFSLQGTSIPEPSTIALLFGGLALLACKRRRSDTL
jgi:PEP-CTERM motif